MREDIQSVLYSPETLAEKVRQMGQRISQDYAGKNPLLVSVLKGSVVFMSDLMRAIEIPCQIDFMMVSSYGAGVKTSGVVKIMKDLDVPLEGRDLIIVEDILDSGKTLHYLKGMLGERHPNSIRIAALLDKPDRRTKPVELHYCGFTIPDAFVVGYGLDYAEEYRNLPHIGILKPQAFEQKSVQRNWRVYRYSGHADDDDLFCRIHDVGSGTA